VTLSQWKCRLCGFDRYHRVRVLRKTGAWYETPFYACSRCSVMFLNASQFDANSVANPKRGSTANGRHTDAAAEVSRDE
jgi:hypothetical protein